MTEYGGVSKKIWLLLAKEGGRWATNEISELLPDMHNDSIGAKLRDMAAAGRVMRYEGSPIKWGITKACEVPAGVRLLELEEAGLVR